MLGGHHETRFPSIAASLLLDAQAFLGKLIQMIANPLAERRTVAHGGPVPDDFGVLRKRNTPVRTTASCHAIDFG